MSRHAQARQGWMLFALVLAVSVVLLGTTILNVALPAVQRELHASNSAQQWILNSYTLTFAGFLLVSGVVGDRFGYRRVLIGALALFAVTAAVGSVAHSIALLIVMRALMGIGAAGILPITLAVVNQSVPAPRRPAAITIWVAFSGLSIAFGPLLGGALLNAGLWWGSVLALVAVLAAVSVAATAWFVPGAPGSGVGELRAMPVLGSVAGIGLLIWGVLNGGQDGHWLSAWTLAPLVTGVVVLAALGAAEARHGQPMADVRLFSRSAFTVPTLVIAAGTFSIYGFLYFTTFYLEEARGYSPLQTGLALIPVSAGLIVAAPLSRRVAVAFGLRATMAAGMGVSAAGMAILALIGSRTGVAWFMLDAFAVAFGFGLMLSPSTAAAMSAVPAERAGAGSALLNTLRQVGSALGVAILGSLLWAAYRGGVTPHVAALPGPERAVAANSLAGTLAAAAGHPALAAAGRDAFDHAMHLTTVVAAVICALGMCGVLVTGHRRAARSGSPRESRRADTAAAEDATTGTR